MLFGLIACVCTRLRACFLCAAFSFFEPNPTNKTFAVSTSTSTATATTTTSCLFGFGSFWSGPNLVLVLRHQTAPNFACCGDLSSFCYANTFHFPHTQPITLSTNQPTHQPNKSRIAGVSLRLLFFFSFSFLEGKAKEAKRGREREREVPCVSAWPLILAVAVLSFINVICLLGWQQQTTNNQHTHTPAHTHKHTQRQFF